jgi:TetR/AcrR family fatty acid metabolism transcriptional regulator
MEKWTFEKLRELVDQFSPTGDPQDPKERKRLRIIGAASELFTAQGYRRTSMAQVAQKAGMAKGTVYLYFKTKSELLIQAMVEEKKRYLELLRPILDPSRPARESLRDWLRNALVLGMEMPLVSKILARDPEFTAVVDEFMATQEEDWAAMQHDFLGWMIGRAARPHRWTPAELGDRSRVLLGLLYFAGILTDEHVRRGLSVERFAQILADLIVDGVAGSGGS